MLRGLLKKFPKMNGSIFNADRGYDADANFKRVFDLLMTPNIKQRELQKGVGHKRLLYRSKAKKSSAKERFFRWLKGGFHRLEIT
jgi:hypothetical protein